MFKQRANALAFGLFFGLAAAGLMIASGPSAAMPLSQNLEGYWQFNGNGNDSSGNGRNLNIVGSGIGFGGGLSGQALALPGVVPLESQETNFAIRPIDDSVFNLGSNDFTVQAWVNFSSLAGEQSIVEKFDGPAGGGWTLTKTGGNQLVFFADNGLVQVFPDASTISTGVFHQIVARRLEDEVSVFFDGQLIGTQLLAPGTFIGPSGNPLLIGARNGGQNHPVDGLIDEVAIWTRGISNDDISATFNQGNGAGLLGSQIPEPTSLAILGIGLVVFGFARRKHGFLPSDSH